MKKSVVIFANSRSELLVSCIESVLNSYGSDNWKKIIVLQLGYQDVENVVTSYEQNFDLILRVKKQFDVTLGNINHNRIMGTSICFDLLDSDVVLGIEEDTMIGYDALAFIDQMHEHYNLNPAFRGINLGSHESKTKENLHTYSLLRFGLNSQAGVLTSKTWKRFSVENLLKDVSNEGWDSKMEFRIKTGFMVTPNASRSLDRGWGGTHTPKDPQDPYFERQIHSWVGTNPFESHQFVLKNVKHSWRRDAVPYRKLDSIYFRLRNVRFVHCCYTYLRELGWKGLNL